jgi:oxygen-independent coproporphyrinogen-3 oxidase
VALKKSGINRLSIGIQTFHNSLLSSLHRAHTAETATECIYNAREAGFNNISLDLIYAQPGETVEMWEEDIAKALTLTPEHISCYSLTIEPNTVFGKWTKQGKLQAPDDEVAAQHLEILVERLEVAGYEHYEVSNFAKPGLYSRHNSNYWKGKKYLGIGPSAHSYNVTSRHYTVANNHRYLQSIASGVVPLEKEVLSPADKINEYILTTLRTSWGCDAEELLVSHHYDLLKDQHEYIQTLVNNHLAVLEGKKLTLTKKGKLLADKIASDLFLLP